MKKSFLRASKPAKLWTECYPLGNGNVGVMPTGGIKRDVLHLNDDRLWSGHGQDKWTRDGGKGLEKARQQLLAGDKKGAEDTLWHSVCGEFCEAYMPLGRLVLEHEVKKVKDYTRTLDMNNALHLVSATVDGKEYSAEEYVSYPDKCLVKTIDCQGKLNSTISFSSVIDNKVYFEEGVLVVKGNAPTRVFPNYFSAPGGNVIYDQDNLGMDYVLAIAIDTDGTLAYEGDKLFVGSWSTMRIVGVTEVSFRQGDKTQATIARAKDLIAKDRAILKKSHLDDYCPLFNKVDLTVNDIESSPQNTEKAIKKYHKGRGDEGIVVTEFDFGRYLLIAGSREGTLSTNLQGIWNASLLSPWSCHHTININTEMNYWGAEKVDLHNCILPLIDHLERIAVNGRKVAQETFGLKGWCLHHNTDGWATANPVGGESDTSPMQYAYFPSGGGWLVSQLYESTLYVDDVDFATRVLALAYGAAEFYLDYLVPYGDYLVPLCTTSPENAYLENGKHTYIDKWTTMAVAIIKNTLTAYVDLAERLGKQIDLVDDAKVAISKLPPFALGSDGRLLEYSEEYPEVEKKHRHVSHLYSIFPGNQITYNGTPNLMQGARKVLDVRGLLGTGWSLSWKLNLCARLKDKKAVSTLLKNFNNLIKEDQIIYRGGGCYPSCLCAHPPFQIDGNYGFTSGVCEMLVQSHDGEIELAPCLPPSWKKVVVRGLKARGGQTVAYTYDNGEIQKDC